MCVGVEADEEGVDVVGEEWYGGRLVDAKECRMSSMADTADVAEVGPEAEVAVGEEADETDDSPDGTGCGYVTWTGGGAAAAV